MLRLANSTTQILQRSCQALKAHAKKNKQVLLGQPRHKENGYTLQVFHHFHMADKFCFLLSASLHIAGDISDNWYALRKEFAFQQAYSLPLE